MSSLCSTSVPLCSLHISMDSKSECNSNYGKNAYVFPVEIMLINIFGSTCLNVPDPFPPCGMGSGHVRLGQYVVPYSAAHELLECTHELHACHTQVFKCTHMSTQTCTHKHAHTSTRTRTRVALAH